jgi:hypothetical protein
MSPFDLDCRDRGREIDPAVTGPEIDATTFADVFGAALRHLDLAWRTHEPLVPPWWRRATPYSLASEAIARLEVGRAERSRTDLMRAVGCALAALEVALRQDDTTTKREER